MRITVFSILLFNILLLTSCSNGDNVEIKKSKTSPICEISENITTIGSLFSFDIVNDSTFVLTDNNQVMLYDISGRQIREIGHSGRAEFEYNMPFIVRAYNDTIYVWSAMTLKFIAYSLDGTPIAEYKYNSAIADFCPTDDTIFIYTAGLSFDSIIDVYDMASESVVHSIGQSSDEHKLILHNMSVAPMAYSNGNLFFASKDKLQIMKYDKVTNQLSEFAQIKSQTFVTNALTEDYSVMSQDRNKRRQYLWVNSMALLLNPHSDGIDVLTIEGESVMDGDKLNTDKRYVGLYSIDSQSRNTTDYFSFEYFNNQSLISVYDGDVYFISHSVQNDDDLYTLNRILF